MGHVDLTGFTVCIAGEAVYVGDLVLGETVDENGLSYTPAALTIPGDPGECLGRTVDVLDDMTGAVILTFTIDSVREQMGVESFILVEGLVSELRMP